jgi:NAD(P)-dependent dehydrogenase (short-subunit alcohol dehydrogenase family)
MAPPAYAAVKSGMIGFTRHMANYYGHQNVRINAVAQCLERKEATRRPPPLILNNYWIKI